MYMHRARPILAGHERPIQGDWNGLNIVRLHVRHTWSALKQLDINVQDTTIVVAIWIFAHETIHRQRWIRKAPISFTILIGFTI